MQKGQAEISPKQILDVAGVIILTLDIDAKVTTINKFGCELLGYPAKDIIGKKWFSFIPKDRKEEVQSVFNRIMSGKIKQLEYYEASVLAKGNKIKTVSWHNDVLKNKKGKIIGTISSGLDITEKESAEAKYQNILSSLNDIIYTTDIKGKITFCSLNVKNYGYKQEDIVGKTLAFIIHPDDLVRVSKNFQETMKKGSEFPERFRIRKKDGSYVMVEDFGARVIDKNGKINLHGVLRDVTEKVKIEKKLKDNEEKYRSIFNTSPVSIVIINDKGIMLDANDRVYDWLGYKKEQLIGKHLLKLPFMTEKTKGIIVEKFKKRMFGKEIEPYEVFFEDKNGEIKIGKVSGSVMTKSKGEKIDLVMIADITESKKAEEKIKESEETLRNLMEFTPLSIQGYDTDGIVHHWNKASEKIYGYTRKEAIGKNLSSLIVPPNIKSGFNKALQSGKRAKESGELMPSGEISLLRKDGTFVDVYSTHVVVKTENKDPEMFCIDLDLTEMKKAEEKYKNVIQNATEIILVLQDGKTVMVNPKAFKISGYSEEELMSKAFTDFIHSDDRKMVLENHVRRLKGEKIAPYDFRIMKKEGGYFWVQITAVAFEWEGKPAVLTFLNDITERRSAEERFKFAAQVTSDFIYEWDPKTDSIEWFGDFDQALGYKRNEIPRTVDGWLHVMHPDDRKNLLMQVTKHKKDTTPIDTEYRVMKKDGTVLFWQDSAHPVTDLKGNIIKWIGGCKDITREKEAREEISKTKDRLSELLNHLTVGIYRHTSGDDGHFVEANPAIVKMFEAGSKENFLKHNIADLYIKPIELKEFNKKILKDGYVLNEELKLQTLKGRHFWASFTVVMKSDKQGNVYYDGWIEDIDYRKSADQILEASQAEYNQLIEASLDGFVTLTIDGRFLDCNSAYEKMIGYNIDELRKLKYIQVTPKKWHKEEADLLKKKILKEGKSGLYEKEYIRKDGTVFPVELNMYLIKNKEGDPEKMIAFARDITDRVESENALKDAEAKYRDIVENSPEMIHSIDSNGYVAFANSKEYELLGYKPGELIGIHMSKLYSPNLLKKVKDGFDQLKKEGSLYIPSSQMLRKNGEPIDVEIHSIAIYDKAGKYNGKFVRTRSIARDITKEKKAQIELAKMHLGFERSEQIMFMTDQYGKINYINPSFEKIYGYKKDEVIGKTPKIIKSGKQDKDFYKDFRNTLFNKKPINVELINKTRYGRLINIKSSVNPIIGDNGDIIGFLAIQSDITEQKKAEAELNKKLEQMEFVGRVNLKRHKKMLNLEKEIKELKEEINLLKKKRT